jgi:transcription initiation factor TFIIIB Brf1 subunit/transcription initiation factor TFIIB
MDFAENNCEHLTYADDPHEGTVVCLNCGLVLSNLFSDQISNLEQQQQQRSTEDFCLNEIQDLLDRIHIPACYGHHIKNFLKKNFTTNSKKAIAFSVFKVLNDMDIPVSMKELSLATDLHKKTIHKAQTLDHVVSIDFSEIVEKYTKLLHLPFETTTVIKEKILTAPVTGHNPNSVLAAIIYQVCKAEKRKVSIKTISAVTKVSCISIQRYNKFTKNDCPSR